VEKVEALEEMLTIMPKHKGTDKLRADVRRRISKLKSQSLKKGTTSRRDTAYLIEREGAAQIALIGPPNSGKSSLVAKLTNARPVVAEFPHSTWNPTPGMAHYENIQFQLIDTPPITKEYIEPWMGDLIRRADMVAVLVDLHKDPLKQLGDTFSVLEGLRIFPEGIPAPENLKKAPFFKKMIVLVNKVDQEADQEDYAIFLELWERKWPSLGISSQTGRNLDAFMQMIYDLSNIIRVYSKTPGKKPDRNKPFVLPGESILEELAGRIHKDFISNFKFARIWGESVFDGQMVQRDHVLHDGDVVEIHT
jgi:ribosome-interacting GTPase 1